MRVPWKEYNIYIQLITEHLIAASCVQFIYATWPSIVNYIYRSFFIATSLLRIITIETAFRYSLRRYFHSSKWITMGNPSTRLFINNLDNRYNYVNLTEGKRRVSTLLLSGRKKHRIRSTEQQPYNVSFFSLSLSLPLRLRSSTASLAI